MFLLWMRRRKGILNILQTPVSTADEQCAVLPSNQAGMVIRKWEFIFHPQMTQMTRILLRGSIKIEITYHSVIPSVVEGSQDWLSEMFRLRFAPLNMTE